MNVVMWSGVARFLLVLFTTLALFSATAVRASPANCDDDMTDDQRYQLEVCTSHAGCRIVAGILTSCTSIKSFLGKLKLGGKGSSSRLSDDALNEALTESGVPVANLASCTTKFDHTLCRQYLGLEDEAKADRTQMLIKQMTDLVERAEHFKQNTFYTQVQPSLEACARSRDDKDNRDQTCKHAQANVNICRKEAEYWWKSANAIIAEAREAGSSHQLSDARRQLQAQQDRAAPRCPISVPGTTLEPTQAMEQWDRDDRDRSEQMIGQCEGLRRATSDAIDSGEKEMATAALDRFETSCAKVSATYEGLVRLYRQRVSDLADNNAGGVLTRRGGSTWTGMMNEAVTRAEQEEQGRPLREAQAREQQLREQAEQEREAREQAIRAQAAREQAAREQAERARRQRDSLHAALETFGTVVSVYADAQAKQNEENQRRMQEQQAQQRRVQEQQAEQARQEARQAERQAQQVRDQVVDATSCIEIIEQYGSQYFRNKCSYKVDIDWPAGLWTLGPGGKYPTMQSGPFSYRATAKPFQ